VAVWGKQVLNFMGVGANYVWQRYACCSEAGAVFRIEVVAGTAGNALRAISLWVASLRVEVSAAAGTAF
jgi:hypothetical protein